MISLFINLQQQTVHKNEGLMEFAGVDKAARSKLGVICGHKK